MPAQGSILLTANQKHTEGALPEGYALASWPHHAHPNATTASSGQLAPGTGG